MLNNMLIIDRERYNHLESKGALHQILMNLDYVFVLEDKEDGMFTVIKDRKYGKSGELIDFENLDEFWFCS